MWVANDENYLYIRYTLHVPVNPFTWNVRTFIDGDNNPNTGYHPPNQGSFGSEIGMEKAGAFQQAPGAFYVGTITNASVLQGPASGTVTQIEYRVSRTLTGTNELYGAGERLISSDTIRILMQDDRGAPIYDYMPNTLGVAYTFAPKPPPPSYYKKITIDGVFSDWEGVPSVAASPSKNPGEVDWKEMWIANDEDYLYVKYTLHEAFNPHIGSTMFYINGDNNSASGYLAIGAELMVRGTGLVMQFAGGTWNEGTLTNAHLLHEPKATAKEFEFRIARAVTGVAGAFAGQPLLTSDTIYVAAYQHSGQLIYMPHAKGAIYSFAQKPPPAGTIILVQ